MKFSNATRFTVLFLVLAFAFSAFVTPKQAKAAGSSAEDLPSIVGVAVGANKASGEFSTLIAAVKAAGLVNKLDSKGNFTVFAPTDAAFAKLGLNANNIGSLPKAKLMEILSYHITRGDRFAQGVVSSERIRMLNGDYAKVKVNKDGAFLDNSKISATNIRASNGVIHVIDSVLLPPAD